MNDVIEHQSLQTIRPKVLFSLIERHFPGRNVDFKVNIPSPDIGGMTLLESSILVSLIKLTNATALFEFGTFMGATTLLLAENTAPHAQVVTIDLPPTTSTAQSDNQRADVLKDGHANDAFLSDTFNAQGARCIKRANASVQGKISQILENSLDLDVQARGFSGQFDFVFIDGGHAHHIVQRDTENAYRMLKTDGVVVWHDYASAIHDEVTLFLNAHGAQRHIVHVANTMIAFELFGRFKNLLDLSH